MVRNLNWERVSYPVSNGFILSHEYIKDGNTAVGADAAWIDYIMFPPLALCRWKLPHSFPGNYLSWKFDATECCCHGRY